MKKLDLDIAAITTSTNWTMRIENLVAVCEMMPRMKKLLTSVSVSSISQLPPDWITLAVAKCPSLRCLNIRDAVKIQRLDALAEVPLTALILKNISDEAC